MGAIRKEIWSKNRSTNTLLANMIFLFLLQKNRAGLKTWLEENGYKIPAGADEVLEPYIKSNLKFFVVKVNEEEKKKLPGNFLTSNPD